MTDEELLTDAGRGNQAAFIELYERHRNAVFRFAYRLLGTVELAEDVAHDCFLSLIQHPNRFDPTRAALSTYLFATVRNLAMKHFRRTRFDRDVDEIQEGQLQSNHGQPLVKMLDDEISLIVQGAVAQLPPFQREALILFEYEELSLMAISEIVGADVGTVKARLYRARQGLKRSLAAYFAGWQESAALEEVLR